MDNISQSTVNCGTCPDNLWTLHLYQDVNETPVRRFTFKVDDETLIQMMKLVGLNVESRTCASVD